MDVREKLVEICFHEFCMVAGDSPCGCDGCPYGNYGSDVRYEEYKKDKLENLGKTSVTVQDNTEISEELLKQLRNAPITILQEEPTVEVVQEWISVKDRLPNEPMRFLVYTKRGEYWGYEITYYNQGFYTQYAEAIYWMPLPQPPKGE